METMKTHLKNRLDVLILQRDDLEFMLRRPTKFTNIEAIKIEMKINEKEIECVYKELSYLMIDEWLKN